MRSKSFVPLLYTFDIVYELSVEGKELRNIYSIIVVTYKEVSSPFLTNSKWFGIGIIVCSSKDEICDIKDHRPPAMHFNVFYII